MAAAGLACWPLDRALSGIENRRLEDAKPPQQPILLICGPPRSGTTLVAQYLINRLDVCYLNNLTSIFPNAPLTINRIFGRKSIRGGGRYSAFYGKSRGLRGVNDALYIWDRWLGHDRRRVPEELELRAAANMPAFFGELENLYGKSVVNKVNRLNTCAHLVCDLLPTAYFLFVERDPFWLAQSLYIAREQIGGDMDSAYGTQHPNSIADDPVADVCAQVRFHREISQSVIAEMPPDRVILVSYENFCRQPAELVRVLRQRIGSGMPELREPRAPQKESFSISRTQKLPDEVLSRMRSLLSH